LTAQTVVVSDAKATVKPEDAVACSVNGTVPNGWSLNALKAMV